MFGQITVKIEQVRRETSDITTLFFKRPFEFTAGQYITVFVPGSSVSEGKAYSLSSLPTDDLASITVKNVGGEFSTFLCSRTVGDELTISQAYGNFNPQTTRPLVGIAGGCALSPVWSVLASAPPEQPTFLYYAHKTPDDVVFASELAASKIQVEYFCTRQKIDEKKGWHNGRFEVAKIVNEVPDDAHFLVCGSLEFVKDIWQKLVSNGAGPERISTETFFEV